MVDSCASPAVRQALFQVGSATACVALGKFLNFSEPLFAQRCSLSTQHFTHIWEATHLWLVLTAKAGWQVAWGEVGSFVCLPDSGAVGGSHDSVLPKEGEVKARPLR